MRADRLLSIMLLLQVHHRMTARELAKRLEVSERTIHRDMEALSRAGIPVTAERGIGGGWCLLSTRRATTRVAPTMDELNVYSPLVRHSLRQGRALLRSGHE